VATPDARRFVECLQMDAFKQSERLLARSAPPRAAAASPPPAPGAPAAPAGGRNAPKEGGVPIAEEGGRVCGGSAAVIIRQASRAPSLEESHRGRRRCHGAS